MLAPAPEVRRAHWVRLERIRQRATERILTATRGSLTDLDPEVVTRLVLSSQRVMVRATAAGFGLMAESVTANGRPPVIDPEPLIGAPARQGVPLEAVYARIPVTARDRGTDAARLLLTQNVNIDTQLAQRAAASTIVQADRRITRWRRQVNPGGGETCGLCLAASTNTYSKQNLLPIHPFCRCTVYPIYETVSGTADLDREILSDLYQRSGGATDRSSLGRIRVNADELPDGVIASTIEDLAPRVEWHNEFGPYLTGRNHRSSFPTT